MKITEGSDMSYAVQVVWKQEASSRRIATVEEGFAFEDDAKRYARTCRRLHSNGARLVTVHDDREHVVDPEEVLIWDELSDVRVDNEAAVIWLADNEFNRGSVTVFQRRRRELSITDKSI